MHRLFRSGISVLAGAAMIVNATGIRMFPSDAATDTKGIVFYVSPDGSDSGNGSIDSPFRTLEAARDAVRECNGNMTGDITVYLRGGDYRITNFEMEGAPLAGFAAHLGHNATTVCCAIANRYLQSSNPDYKPQVRQLIEIVVDRLSRL